MGKNAGEEIFRDLPPSLWLGIIRDIDKLKRIYDISNTIVSFGTISLLRKIAFRLTGDSKTIIEVGSGPGTFLKKLTKLKNRTIIALDPSPPMLYYSTSKIRSANYVLGLAESMPFKNNSIDVIFCIFSFRDFFNKEKFISEAWRVLRRHGKLIIVDTNNARKLSTRLFLHYIIVLGRLYSIVLRRNILIGLARSIIKMKPVETYVRYLYETGFRKIYYRKFLLGNAFILVAVK